MTTRNVTGGFGSAKKNKAYSGPDSTKPTQRVETDLATTGGTAPGGIVAFPASAKQWATSNAANRNNYPKGEPNVDPIGAAKMMHVGLKDESPAEKGDVPVHPGFAPGLYRTATDANYEAPDGQTNLSPNETGGHPLSPSGKYRGESPEIEKQTRGSYRP